MLCLRAVNALVFPAGIKFGDDFRYLANHGMMGTDFDSCCHNWATQGLNYYIAAKLHWDPQQDVDALVEDYCRVGFGPAAKSIRRYFGGLEALLDETATKKEKVVSVFTAKALSGLRNELEQAAKDAQNDTLVSQRIEFLELGLRWTEIEVRAHGHLADVPKAEKQAAKRTLDERYDLMQEILRSYRSP